MPGRLSVKVCGITRAEDAHAAAALGADYLGVILHPASPRHVPLERFRGLRRELPDVPKVGVLVEPDLHAVGAAVAAGFDILQVHFPAARWSEFAPWLVAQVGVERLWLAPRLPPGSEPDEALLRLGKTFLLDAYQPGQYGGTGHTGDWGVFAALRRAWHGKVFVLAGGLNPGNVAAALAATDTRWLDVNSGVESSPGVKDHAQLRAFFAALPRTA